MFNKSVYSCRKVGLNCTDLQLFWWIWEHRGWSWRVVADCYDEDDLDENHVDYIQPWVTRMMNHCQSI